MAHQVPRVRLQIRRSERIYCASFFIYHRCAGCHRRLPPAFQSYTRSPLYADGYIFGCCFMSTPEDSFYLWFQVLNFFMYHRGRATKMRRLPPSVRGAKIEHGTINVMLLVEGCLDKCSCLVVDPKYPSRESSSTNLVLLNG